MTTTPETDAYLAQFSRNVIPRWMLWMSGRNRSTDALEYTGLWTGDDDQGFVIEGQSRSYFGAGGLISVGALTYEAGTQIQMQQVTLGPLTPEVTAAIRLYDPQFCPAELHLAFMHPDTGQLAATERVFKGWIDEAPISEAPLSNGLSGTVCTLTLASRARQGTRTLTLKKSDSDMRQRSGDRGMRYADVSGSVSVWWGQKKS